jgi:centrosomal protein CEP76
MQSSSDRFHTYSSAWWNDYKELKLPVRPVKLYAESQDGVWRPSSSFVTELVAVRGILTPNHAARFVSLIPFKRSERGPESNPERAEIWHKFTTFLSIRNGDFEDHCLLLCSLLLGFHLEAYVVIGASTDGAHGWVMTRQAKSLKPMAKRQVPEYTYHFWESLTGHKFELGDPRI